MFRSHQLYQEICHPPLIERVPELKVPVHSAAGAHYYVTPSGQARAFCDAVAAPHKTWTEFAGSAHAPLIEQPEQFRKLLSGAIGHEGAVAYLENSHELRQGGDVP